MRILSVVALLAIMIVSGGCDKDKEGTLEIVFRGTYGSNPLVMFEDYGYAFGQRIEFSKSDFYLSNVRLAAPNGLPEEVLEVELVDLSFSNAQDAAEGYSILIDNIPAQTYNRMDFGIGLDVVQNGTRPEDYASDHPLATPRYWEPWESYIFAKYEGNLDTLANGNADLGFLFHTGRDDMYASLSTTETLTITDGGTTRIVFTLDHRNLLGVGSNPLNIKDNPINHTPNDTSAIMQITQNYATSLTFVVE